MVFHLSRINKMCFFFGFFTVLLLGRLFYLQLIEGPHLTLESLSGRVQEVPVDIARGEILDRNNVSLTNTAQHFSIVIFPDQLKESAQIAKQLAAISGKDENRIDSLLQTNHRPFKLKTDIDAVTAQKINSLKLAGVLAVAEKVRYSFTSLGAHLVGYTNTADNRGVSGLEAMYDEVLRGSQPEYVAALVDATQQLIPGLGYKKLRIAEGTGPSHIILTIDTRIQKVVESIMDKQIEKGAVVVMRPSTGEILAMASRPNFDANHLDSYLTSSAAPFMNRALSAYQPGSVFKLVLAAAALENKIVKPQDVFFDPGYVDVN
ncbi:penicillin-binding transpeptidase domain-containing protein, partial [Anaerospora sp.]